MAAETKTADVEAVPTAGKFWVTAPDGVAPERKSGSMKGFVEPPRRTVFEVFAQTVSKFGDHPALRWVDGPLPKKDGELDGVVPWKTLTWRQYYDESIRFAKSLLATGFQPFQSVNIMGFNHKNWLLANLGAIAAGGMAAGIYTTNKAEATSYIVEHCDAHVGVIEDGAQLEKWGTFVDSCPKLKHVVIYRDVIAADKLAAFNAAHPGCVAENWEDFLKHGESVTTEQVQERLAAQKPSHCCTLIYTSGTTGPPKGVMLSHDNICFTAGGVMCPLFGISEDDRMVSYLPLSHIAAQMLDLHGPMARGTCVYFSSPQALKGELKLWLQAVQPTVVFGVPRVWAKIMDVIKAKAAAAPAKGGKKKLIDWAKSKATQLNDNIQYGGSGKAPTCYGLAYKLVLSKVRAALGMTHTRICATGAAPISKEILAFFASLGLPIYEVFGQSECTGPQTVNYPDPAGGAGHYRVGWAGPAIPGSEMITVDPQGNRVDTGELIYRGRHIMMGYLKNPEKTRETIDDKGWLHSGDEATIDPDGFMRITGRLKELIITEGGENIPPVLIENAVKAACPAISNVVVIGDHRKFLMCLVSLKCQVNPDTLEPTDDLDADALTWAKANGAATTVTAAKTDPKWGNYIHGCIATANKDAASKAQEVKKWRLLDKDFSLGSGFLTPTMKLKRSVVHAAFKDVIDAAYDLPNNPPDAGIPLQAAAAGAGAGAAN